jgi:hypothetical protein
MNAVNHGKADEATPSGDGVCVYGIPIPANSCKSFLISANEVSFRYHIP